MAKIIDCSMVVSNRIWRFRTDISTRQSELLEIEGVSLREKIRTIHMSAHCVTHIDAPAHYVEGAPNIIEISIERCFGEAAVIDLTDKGELDPITAEDLEERGKHVKEDDIVLLKTGWTEKNAGGNTEKMEGLPANWDYWRGPYPTRSMAEWMVKKKVRAVGYDCPNELDSHNDIVYTCTRKGPKTKIEGRHVHRILLSHGIMQIEYLCNLTAIKKNRVKFFAVPLKINIEATPVRAFAIEE